jgi:hypothetical protein
MGEGFQSNMNFSFSIREKVAVWPDEGPSGNDQNCNESLLVEEDFSKIGLFQ